MSKVPSVDLRDMHGLSEQALRVSGLAVDRAKSRPVLVLSVNHLLYDGTHERTVELVLSPPAAAQLSQLLEETVDGYLYGAEETEE